MDATFRFSSTQEITEEFIEHLKNLYKGKAISITVKDETVVSDLQKEEVLRRQNYVKNHPEALVDFDEMMVALEKELQDED